jgi:FMN phosphatase YigB (HAD superfamily)
LKAELFGLLTVMPQMIDAVLFDLDETITDRSASLAKYAALFHREFSGFLNPMVVEQIEATFLALDNRGYRPREEVYAGIVATLSWNCAPDTSVVAEHWRMWCPRSAIGRIGLHETLSALTQAGIRVGVVTNGSESSQSAKIAQLEIDHYFSAVVISEVVQCEKPDPRIFSAHWIRSAARLETRCSLETIRSTMFSARLPWVLSPCGLREFIFGRTLIRVPSAGFVRCRRCFRFSPPQMAVPRHNQRMHLTIQRRRCACRWMVR